MELKIVWTDFAKSELKNIYAYHKNVASEKIAKKLVTKLVAETKNLSHHPESGQIEELLVNRPQKFRYLISGNYKIIYWANLDKNRIEILDVFDCRQNPIKIKRNK